MIATAASYLREALQILFALAVIVLVCFGVGWCLGWVAVGYCAVKGC